MSRLEALAAKKAGKAAKAEWSPPQAADFRDGSVIGVDQSLANCGIVQLAVHNGRLGIMHAEMLRTVAVHDGPEDSLLRFEQIRRQLNECFAVLASPSSVCHETPPIIRRGVPMQRPEASWLAAAAVRAAAGDTGRKVVMLGAQHHKKVTSGNGNAKKPEHHRAMMGWLAGLDVVGLERVTNEDLRDALSIALTYQLEA